MLHGELTDKNKAQLINYFKTTDKEIGLLLNFGRTSFGLKVPFSLKEDFCSESQQKLDFRCKAMTTKKSIYQKNV